MGFVDLHVHSTASDGTLSPAQVVSLAKTSGLKAIALTDHDTTAGIKEAAKAAEDLGLELIPGIEVSSTYEGQEIHILGLFVNPEDASLKEALRDLRVRRDRRNEEMLARFARDGITFTREDLCGSHPDTVITRAHVARALIAKGFGSSPNQVFKKYLSYGGPYCPPKELLEPEAVMNILLSNRAFVSLAHPWQYHLGNQKTEKLISLMASLGMKGLEVYHSSHNQLETRKLQELAAKYGLLPTGGSDFHGANKPDICIGTGRGGLKVSSLLLDAIKSSRKASDF